MEGDVCKLECHTPPAVVVDLPPSTHTYAEHGGQKLPEDVGFGSALPCTQDVDKAKCIEEDGDHTFVKG
eukprot:2506918-Prorocentrum_lima.AAC.1